MVPTCSLPSDPPLPLPAAETFLAFRAASHTLLQAATDPTPTLLTPSPQPHSYPMRELRRLHLRRTPRRDRGPHATRTSGRPRTILPTSLLSIAFHTTPRKPRSASSLPFHFPLQLPSARQPLRD
jgi:hypothetical protein